VTLVIVLILAIGYAITFTINLPYFALVPGQAQAVVPLLTVPPGKAHNVSGQLLLTDVGEADVTVGNWLYFHFDSDATLYPKSDFILTGVTEGEYDAEGTVEMEESQLTAAAVSMRQLGYSVPYYNAGVLVWAMLEGTDAFNVLQVGDVITALDGTPTPDVSALQSTLVGRKPGQTVTLTIGSVTDPKKGHNVSLKLAGQTTKEKVNGKEKEVTRTLVGIIQPFNQPGWDFPFKVSVDLNNIGGPSAGLAFTLGLIDRLGGGNLTGGRTIAATGTICADGSVGQVGGVPQKTVAVENAKASVFLVPQPELSQAQSKGNGSLHIEGVNTLQQALNALKSLGGKLGQASKGPVPGPGGHSVPTGLYAFPCGY
jgi:Lon-like protease